MPGALSMDASPSSETIYRGIESDSILDKSIRFRVSLTDQIATVSTFRHPLAKRKDLKIDALLLARQVFRGSDAVSTVRVLFFDIGDNSLYWQVPVERKVLDLFADGFIACDRVLSLLSISSNRLANPILNYNCDSYDQIISPLPIARNSRDLARLNFRLERLKSLGIDVSGLQSEMLELADALRNDDRARVYVIQAHCLLGLESLESRRRLSRADNVRVDD